MAAIKLKNIGIKSNNAPIPTKIYFLSNFPEIRTPKNATTVKIETPSDG